jgi:probable phosphoglycerate mutase
MHSTVRAGGHEPDESPSERRRYHRIRGGGFADRRRKAGACDGENGRTMTDTAAPPETSAADTPSAEPAPAAADGQEAATESPKPTTLVLARHAVTEQTGPLLTGRAPGVDLSEDGRKQAAALAERLADLPVAAVYASPIERTAQTAAAVAERHGLAVHSLAGALEADYGEWTGGKLADLAKTDLWKTVQRAPSRARFPGGESMTEMQARIVGCLEAVVADHPGDIVVVVSHADPIKAAIAHYTGLHLDQFQRIVVSPASVTAFQLSAHGAALVKCNDTGNLDELRPPPPEKKEAQDG